MDQFELFEKNYFSINKPIRLITLFSGYGSQEMGLRNIGADFEIYKAVEFDKYAMNSYNAIHNTSFKPTDIRNVKGEDLEITDTILYCYLMFYSFPCTDLSLAGKQAGMKKGSGTRSGLLWEVERLLTECKQLNGNLPQVLCMENVPQVLSAEGFNDWLKFLRSLGYSNFYQILNTKDYGIPQNRERCFMFSFLGQYDYDFPAPIELKYRLKDVLEDEVEEKYYINNEKSEKLIKDLIDRKVLPFKDENE